MLSWRLKGRIGLNVTELEPSCFVWLQSKVTLTFTKLLMHLVHLGSNYSCSTQILFLGTNWLVMAWIFKRPQLRFTAGGDYRHWSQGGRSAGTLRGWDVAVLESFWRRIQKSTDVKLAVIVARCLMMFVHFLAVVFVDLFVPLWLTNLGFHGPRPLAPTPSTSSGNLTGQLPRGPWLTVNNGSGWWWLQGHGQDGWVALRHHVLPDTLSGQVHDIFIPRSILRRTIYCSCSACCSWNSQVSAFQTSSIKRWTIASSVDTLYIVRNMRAASTLTMVS